MPPPSKKGKKKKMQAPQLVCGLYAFLYVRVCVCVQMGYLPALAYAAGPAQRVRVRVSGGWGGWRALSSRCSKVLKKRRTRGGGGGGRSAVKVAEAHKRKERDRKTLLSLIRVSASPTSFFGEPKQEPTFSPFLFPFSAVSLKTFSL